MKAYLINLDRSPGRLAEADAQLRAAAIPYERIPAVDGRALGWAALRRRVSRFRFFLVHGRFPNLGEVACSLSHLEACRRLLVSDEPAALVFEDDVLLDPAAFRHAIDLIRPHLDPTKPDLFLLCDHEGASGHGIVPAGDAHFAEAFAGGAPVGVSVRRGDYLRLPHRHPFVGRGFLRRALEAFPEGTGYLVCSDDLPWCRRFFTPRRFPGRRFWFVEGMSPLRQLWAQSLCAHNVISNSSFSWWGAWLNATPGRRVLAPTRWFGPDCGLPADAPGLSFAGMERLPPGPDPWLPVAAALARGRIAAGDCLRALGLRRRVREGEP